MIVELLHSGQEVKSVSEEYGLITKMWLNFLHQFLL